MAKMTPRTLSGFMELLPGPQQQMERIMGDPSAVPIPSMALPPWTPR